LGWFKSTFKTLEDEGKNQVQMEEGRSQIRKKKKGEEVTEEKREFGKNEER